MKFLFPFAHTMWWCKTYFLTLGCGQKVWEPLIWSNTHTHTLLSSHNKPLSVPPNTRPFATLEDLAFIVHFTWNGLALLGYLGPLASFSRCCSRSYLWTLCPSSEPSQAPSCRFPLTPSTDASHRYALGSGRFCRWPPLWLFCGLLGVWTLWCLPWYGSRIRPAILNTVC